MKKKEKRLLSIIALILIAIGVYFLVNIESIQNGGSLAKACRENGGKWLPVHQECENFESREWCEEAGGIYNECESACRHAPETEFCTLQCVVVCKF
jgi:hypothetical protein